jgi:DNA-binding MarR family transcriptional regulator/N-acetylglutamate synthase-like GNAT family acetyltransferase
VTTAHLTAELEDGIDIVRRFNRFYTRQIGLLQEGLLHSEFSLSQARVIWELANRQEVTARELADELGLDPGYLSRMLRGFQQHRLIRRRPSKADGRQQILSLTATGQKAFNRLDAASRGEIKAMLSKLDDAERGQLTRSMMAIETALGEGPAGGEAAYVLRPHRAGDMGWVVHRHGVLYGREYGWDETFEALVAEIVAGFLRTFDPQRERCWIAQRRGENVGSVFLMKHPQRKGVAQLRLLLLEPGARGLGLGRRLVEECTRFAQGAGYHTITLWTNSVLHAARRIYQQAGYQLLHEEPHHSFGHDLVGQTWELGL